MTTPLPPHLHGAEGVDPEAEQVISALLALGGHPRWRVDGEHTAEWVLAKLKAAHEEIVAAEVDASEYRQRIDEWLHQRTAKARGTVAWAEHHLEEWLRELNDQDPSVKSRVLPSGKVTSVAGRERWTISEGEFLDWAVVNAPELTRTIPMPFPILKAALVVKDGIAITADGEIAEGVSVTRGERTFKATPG